MTTLNKVNSQRMCSSTLFQVLAFGRKDEHDQSFQLTKNLLPYCQRFTFIHVHSPLNKIIKSHFVGPQSTFKRSQNPFSWGLVEVLQVFLMNYWWMIPVSRDSPGNRTGFPHALRPRRRENFEAHGARHHARARKTPWAPRQSFASKIRNCRIIPLCSVWQLKSNHPLPVSSDRPCNHVREVCHHVMSSRMFNIIKPQKNNYFDLVNCWELAGW